MSIVLTNSTFSITRSIPKGESVADVYSGKLHVEITYPDKTIQWLEAGEVMPFGTSVTFVDCSPDVFDPVTGDLTTAGDTGYINVDFIPLVEGRHKITVYSGTLDDKYTKVGSKSFKVVASNSYSKTVYTRTESVEIRYYDITNGTTF